MMKAGNGSDDPDRQPAGADPAGAAAAATRATRETGGILSGENRLFFQCFQGVSALATGRKILILKEK